ncbi:MAG TPA: DUF4157 domain-containing protein [Kofleriaceae bacterium]|nr:DUF4157 domain-containing protein [Kofleriaceae bacterium]
MTRVFYPPELDYSRQRDSFDPIREGERYGLLPELSLAIWKRVSEDATDISGRRNEDQALEQFRELAARITARGRRLRPDPGRLTRVGTEIHGEWPGTWAADELKPRVPGRQTLVEVEARRWANWAGHASATMADGSSRSGSSKGDRAVIYDAARAGHLAACLARLLAPERAGEFADVALLLSAVEPPVARAALSLLRHMPGGAPTQSALEALNDVTAGQASRLLANPPARDVTPAHLRPMHDASAVAPPRRSFVRSGGPSFVSRDLAAHLPARDVSDLGEVEPALVDQGDGGEPLPPAIAARMRELLHHDFTHVRLHTGAAAAGAAAALGARAFTLGDHIYFNRDQFAPDTPLGERLLIHELTHVVQYDEGRLPHADGGFKVSDPGSATEREARAAEDSASRLSPKEHLREPVPAPPARTTATGPAVAEIQRAPHDPPQTPPQTSAARVAFVREAGLNLRAGPDQKAASLKKMKFGQRVHVLEDSGTGEWLKIAVLGQTGYVYKPRVHFPSQDLIEKDPGLTLIKVKPGQTFWGLVKETYGIQGNESSRDQNINHFINAIRTVNPKPEAFKVKTDILDDIGNAAVSGRDASDTELIAGVDLWIPSFGVAAKMDVGSGTVTGEVARYAKKFQQKIDDFGAACRASGKYILPAIGRHAGEMAMGMLQGLVDFALDAAKILAGSTAVGALLGSFFGGVGAVPGAEIGFEVGLLILHYYGLYMLAEAVLGVADQLLLQLGQFIALAWEANGDKAKIEKAGEALAEALGIFGSALLVVVAAWLLKRGAKALNKTKFAQKVGETRLAKWFEERQKMTTTQDPLAKEKAAKAKAEPEKAKAEPEKTKAEPEKAKAEPEKAKAEPEKLEKDAPKAATPYPAEEFPATDQGWQKWPPPEPAKAKPGWDQPGGTRYRYDRYRYDKWLESNKSTSPPKGLKGPKEYFERHVAPKARGQSPGEPGSPQHKALVNKVHKDNFIGTETRGTRRPDAVGKVDQAIKVGDRTITPKKGGRVLYEAENFYKDGSQMVAEGRKQVRQLRADNPNATIVVQDVANPNNIVVYEPGAQPPPGGRLKPGTPNIEPVE